jgi:hypothetical protein
MSSQSESYSAFVRGLILNNHALTFEQLLSAHDEAGWDASRRPKEKQLIYAQRTLLCKRWGVNSVDELPVNSEGKPNLSGMVRLFLKKHGLDAPYSKAVSFFKTDGLEISDALFHNARGNLRKKDSPDDNQHNGPRAGKPQKPAKTKVNGGEDEIYFDMLIETKKLVHRVGGIGPARKMLDILEMIRNEVVGNASVQSKTSRR